MNSMDYVGNSLARSRDQATKVLVRIASDP
jgi:hypothetical protein